MKQPFKHFLKATLIVFTIFCSTTCPCLSEALHEQSFAEVNNAIERTKDDIKTAEKKWIEQFDNREHFYKEKKQRLQQIDLQLKSYNIYNNLLADYRYVVDLWRMFADHSFDNISGTNIERSFPKIPTFSDELLETLSIEELENTKESLSDLREMVADSLKSFEKKQESDALAYSQILLAAGKLRSKQYQRLLSQGYITSSMLSDNNLKDLGRELRIIPVRWTATFYSKILEFRAYLSTGIEGYLYILKETSILFLLVGFFVVLGWAFHKVVGLFERLATNLYSRLSDSSSHWIWGISSNLISHSIPWLILLLAMWFAIGVVSTSSFREFSNIFPYIDFYIYYRLILILFNEAFVAASEKKILSVPPPSKAKAICMSRSIGRYIFFSLAMLHTVDTVVGKAMIYTLLSKALLLISFLYSIYLASRWSHEFYQSRQWSSISRRLNPQFRLWVQRHWIVSTFFSMAFTFLHWSFYSLIHVLERYDAFKKVSAILFRSKLNKLDGDDFPQGIYTLPRDYTLHFDNTDLRTEFIKNRPEYIKALSQVNDWISGKGPQHTIVLYGASGSGKSCLLNQISNNVEGANIVQLEIINKEINPASLLHLLKSKLGGTRNDPQELSKEWSKTIKRKTIVCIDNTHNLFLSQLNGFDALRTLMALVNSDIENIFWCMSFHKESWQYLRQIMDEAHGLDTVLELESWSPEEIQRFIKKAHAQSGYKVSYDGLLSILGKKRNREDRNSIESKFFKLLWEQANGNPTRAVRLWLKSLDFDGKQTMRVTRPPMLDVAEFLDYEDEVHFVCTSLLRHEVLQRQQISSTTQQSEYTTARVVKFLLEKEIIVEEDKELRINPDLAGSIIRSLRRRNYVYG